MYKQVKPRNQKIWNELDLRVLMGFHKSGKTASDLVDVFTTRTESAIKAKANLLGVSLSGGGK